MITVWPRTIRGRTTLAATVLTAVTLSAAAWLLVAAVEDSLTDSRDQATRAELRALAATVSDGRVTDPISVGEDEMAQVVDADGRVVARSANLGDAPAVTSLAPAPGTTAVVVRTGVPDDEDRETFRIWASTVTAPGGDLRVYVGSSPERVQEAVDAARNGLLIGVPAVAGALALLTWWLVGRALAPVERVRAEVAGISASDLERRVPVPASGDEISRLAGTMNQMLARLASGRAREREFVADASHELLSPLAALRAQLEVAEADPAGVDAAPLLADLREDVLRMERLVRDLLLLARAEQVHEPAGLPLVDLDDVVLTEARRLATRAGLVLDTGGVSAAPVRGRSEELARLVRNLLENAASHAHRVVTVRLGATDDRVELEVADDGPGVAPELSGRVFDRFVTSSTARQAGEGTGLGLAIARAVAEAHGGTLTLDDGPDEPTGPRGAVFRLRLPGA